MDNDGSCQIECTKAAVALGDWHIIASAVTRNNASDATFRCADDPRTDGESYERRTVFSLGSSLHERPAAIRGDQCGVAELDSRPAFFPGTRCPRRTLKSTSRGFHQREVQRLAAQTSPGVNPDR